jgi:hypothetical protein
VWPSVSSSHLPVSPSFQSCRVVLSNSVADSFTTLLYIRHDDDNGLLRSTPQSKSLTAPTTPTRTLSWKTHSHKPLQRAQLAQWVNGLPFLSFSPFSYWLPSRCHTHPGHAACLRRVDAERTEDVAAIQLFHGIYGVGMHECRFSLVSLLLFLHHTQGHRLRI